jgi:pre-mRNA-processing factor 19
VKSLVFDQSGTYLAVGGTDIRVYICKQWSEVLNFTGKRMHCVCVCVILLEMQWQVVLS